MEVAMTEHVTFTLPGVWSAAQVDVPDMVVVWPAGLPACLPACLPAGSLPSCRTGYEPIAGNANWRTHIESE
jgi:hypothetical protein